ncbi:hypothetical protein CRG98_015609 [Punica granatum]|uniref:Uncharacterized protein n=1 Tax=Punica granatum TaxID=22663 RepID=A0A2I0K8F3_PUNGR|nr:hypothetical protein CRG98_015609 [Punica granatum]
MARLAIVVGRSGVEEARNPPVKPDSAQLWNAGLKSSNVKTKLGNGLRRGVYGPECGLSSGPALRAFGSRGLGVSTFPWGRVTDTRERRSRHLSFYDPKVEGG